MTPLIVFSLKYSVTPVNIVCTDVGRTANAGPLVVGVGVTGKNFDSAIQDWEDFSQIQDEKVFLLPQTEL